jgi:hypothetical protein
MLSISSHHKNVVSCCYFFFHHWSPSVLKFVICHIATNSHEHASRLTWLTQHSTHPGELALWLHYGEWPCRIQNKTSVWWGLMSTLMQSVGIHESWMYMTDPWLSKKWWWHESIEKLTMISQTPLLLIVEWFQLFQTLSLETRIEYWFSVSVCIV